MFSIIIMNFIKETPNGALWIAENIYNTTRFVKTSLVFLFYGFFVWFSTPISLANLGDYKEQSCSGYDFCQLSIQQSFKVLAMSTLTTSDLEALTGYPTRIVASIVPRPGTLMVQSGERP
jgi:hypothetical protein